jgi:hypothetical protein
MLDRLIATRQSIDLALTDAFIDANSLETIEGKDEIDDFFPRILILWT